MQRPGAGPAPFEEARARLTPVFQALGFRLFAVELPERGSRHAFAEFARRDLRIRLVYEGEEQVLWLEAARQAGSEIVSRWTDIEWSIAGARRPLERGLDDARLDRLEGALGAFVAMQPDTRHSA
jgi:hypothetical protein